MNLKKKYTSPFIIAEIGINHNGSIARAKKIINFASVKGINAIKFQFFKASKITTADTNLAPYQKKNSNTKSQFNLLSKYELNLEDHIFLKNYCEKKKIEYMTSFFDIESINYHNVLDLKRLKIPSGELTNVPYLEKIAKINKQILLSTGMSTLNEIKFAIQTIIKKNPYHKKNLILMQCTSQYPTDFKNVNLNVLRTYENLGFKTGFSDHTLGYEASSIATALGVSFIEKHITTSNNLSGPDHKASLSLENFEIFLKKIKETNEILGTFEKKPSSLEIINKNFVRKKIIAKKEIKLGEYFTTENLTTKRSKNGIDSINWYKLIGKKAKKNYKKDQNV